MGGKKPELYFRLDLLPFKFYFTPSLSNFRCQKLFEYVLLDPKFELVSIFSRKLMPDIFKIIGT
jgi:hypothetical protein